MLCTLYVCLLEVGRPKVEMSGLGCGAAEYFHASKRVVKKYRTNTGVGSLH